jgi:FSR family fosmidomycin resistance protein-like MFS transporter
LTSPDRSKQIRSLFSFSAFHFLDDGFADFIYLLLPFIAAELSLSFSEVGFLKGAFSSAMSLFQLPLGLLGERIGEITVLLAGSLGLAGGFFFLSRVHTFSAVFFSLVLGKAIAAGQHSLGSSVLSRVFETSGRRAAMGTYNFAGDLGKVCVPFIGAVLIGFVGWRDAVAFISLGGGAAGVMCWALARQRRAPAHSDRNQGLSGKREKGWGIRDPLGFSALAVVGVLDQSARVALLTFLPFLLVAKGLPAGQVGFALSLLFAGGAAGKLVCGLAAERLGVIPMVIGTEILTSAGIFSLTLSSFPLLWLLLPVVGFFLNGTSSVLYATVAEMIAPEGRSRGYGIYYAVTLGAGAASPVLFGWLIDAFSLSPAITGAAVLPLLILPLSRFLIRGVPRS